jgi:TatD DNase family protein
MSLYVDAHCHIDRFESPSAVIASVVRAGVVTIAVTDVPSGFQILATQLRDNRLVRVALGFHPLSSVRDARYELALFDRLLDRTDYVGEIGLDYSAAGRHTMNRQREIFEHILSQPQVRGKVLSVHSRQAEVDTIALLVTAEAHAVLHWYSGPRGQIDHALAAGLYFSVNPSMLRSQNGRSILKALPRDRVVTETDGPYAQIRGRPAEPQDVPEIITDLARLWEMTRDETRDLVFANMTRLYQDAQAVEDPPVGVSEAASPAQG